jgi:PH (Pleckstrin Homology) domain-containing protein
LQVRLLPGVPGKIMSKKYANDHEQDFDGQRDGEQLLFVFRRHVIAMRKGFYLLLIPFAVSSIPPLIWQNNLELFILPVIGLAIGLILFAYHFIMWYFTIYIVTDQRIRQITQKGFFGKDVIELRLSKIQNISYNIPGFSGEIFHFGTVVIQTFVGDLVIHKVEHPDKIYNKLQDAVSQALANPQQGEYEETTV